jgi:hypothetical protein
MQPQSLAKGEQGWVLIALAHDRAGQQLGRKDRECQAVPAVVLGLPLQYWSLRSLPHRPAIEPMQDWPQVLSERGNRS